MSAYFTNSLTLPTSLAPTCVVLAAGPFSVGQRAARSLPERWPALPFVGAALRIYGFKAINARTGAAWSPAFKSGAEMDAKARDLTLLAALSLFFAMAAWAGDRDILGSAFFALGLVAIWGAALPRR